ncbi:MULTISPECIES: trypsin-like peptidase domain-containing protein [unclassified Microbacterium]|uniref:trypsin-like peptidase domain-containing protein n=1 Tax=unclassified Microbacterium TaxID=2609290 RepID=UPI00214B74B2|nr:MULTISPECIES: trypsin-like peptidase domain-containing protein [unclassified Microbacterium]MCR2784495.1 trypsin-like peptidase domain-containing protein [Microbacterium sp. zg.B96]WIM14693.1 trypsin-like peptidase domain-containing protein [Microbacterium sp. zg-B96]
MNENEGIRPEDIPASGSPEQPAPVAPERPPLPTQPAAQSASQPGPYAGQPYPGAPQRPGVQPPYGSGQPAGRPYGAPAPGYGAPQQSYAGNASATQPTAPLSGTESGGTRSEKSTVGAGKVAALMVAAALVGGTAGLGGAYAGVNIWSASQPVTASGPASVTINEPDEVNQTTGVAAKVVPSSVTIAASSGDAGGTGSGVILTEDGYVVTNTHVVTLDGATSDAALSVTTADGRVYDAEIVGLDPLYDLAVIKLVDAEGLTPIEFAESGDLNVGDVAIAVGAPLGLSNTVTNGIVSALNRSIQIASSAAPETPEDGTEQTPPGEGEEGPYYFDFGQGEPQQATSTISISVLQTDAAINPGNSGGALVDDEGKLIGINVAIATAGSSGESGSIGVGFSIPSDIVKRITDELIETGEASHGLLGAMVAPAASVEGATTTGAYIDEVTEGGAAAEAGLRAGDIVTGFDGLPITDATDLTAQVRAVAGGSEVSLTVIRDGETRTVDVTLGDLTD